MTLYTEYSPYVTWKQCTKCKIEREFEDFPQDKGRLDGMSSHCKYCKSKYKRLHHKRYPHRQIALNAARRAQKIQATPKWYNSKEVTVVYKEARALGKGYHVDHIVPLNGELVCGLHCKDNLQILTAVDNLKKSNKHDS